MTDHISKPFVRTNSFICSPEPKTIRFDEADLQPTDYKPVGWSIEKVAPIEGLPTSAQGLELGQGIGAQATAQSHLDLRSFLCLVHVVIDLFDLVHQHAARDARNTLAHDDGLDRAVARHHGARAAFLARLDAELLHHGIGR